MKNIIILFAYLYLIYNYAKCCNTTKVAITVTFLLVLTLNNIDGLDVNAPPKKADDAINIPVKENPLLPNPNPNPRRRPRHNRRIRQYRRRNYLPYLYERPVFIQKVVPETMSDIFSLQNLLLFLLYLYLMIFIIKTDKNKLITTLVIFFIIFYDRIINIKK